MSRECPHCGRLKPESAFYPDRKNRLGRRYRCKTCDNQSRIRRRHRAAERNTAQ